MADTFAQRLEQALAGEKPHSFAKRAAIPDSTLRSYLGGKMPGVEKLLVLAEAAGVTLDWLAAGRGPMHSVRPPEVVGESAARNGDLVPVPYVMASASAGPGLVPIDEGTLEELFSAGFLRRYGLFPRSTAALPVEGDSMLRADGTGIPSGALALINTAITDEDVITGCIYVLVRGDELMVKRIERNVDGSITLHSDNPRYRPQVVPIDIMDQFHIVGRLKVAVLEF